MDPDTYTVLQQSEFRGARSGRKENRRKGSARRKNRHKGNKGKSQTANARKKGDLKQKGGKRRKKKGSERILLLCKRKTPNHPIPNSALIAFHQLPLFSGIREMTGISKMMRMTANPA